MGAPRLLSVGLGALLTAGCAAERFGVHGSDCDARFWRWSDDLTGHLMAGNRREGSWDYDPIGRVQARNRGQYSFETGDFSWQVGFDPAHYRRTAEVEGFGYAAPNGDLDLLYTRRTTFIDDDVREVEVREERVGCDLTRTTTAGASFEAFEGTFSRGFIDYTRVTGDRIAEGTLARAGTWFETRTGPGYSATARGDADGASTEEWEEQAGSTNYVGVTELFIDGSAHYRYTQREGDVSLVWEYEVDFFGDGTGTVSGENLSCTLTFTRGVCDYDCGGGDAGRC